MYLCILFGLSTSTLSTTMFYECWYFIRFSTLALSLTAMFLYVGILFHPSHFIAAMFYVCCILFGRSTALVLCICWYTYWGGGWYYYVSTNDMAMFYLCCYGQTSGVRIIEVSVRRG